MTNLVYLLVPLTVAAIVVAVLYWRDRRPTSVNEGIEQFRDGLRALSPDSGPRLPNQPVPGPRIYSSYGVPDGQLTTSPRPVHSEGDVPVDQFEEHDRG